MKLYALSDILKLTEVTPLPGKPEWANIKTIKLRGRQEDLAGGGVYACFWKNKLIYIGKFINEEKNPLGGHVFDRIGKHAAGFLQRDYRLFFYKGPFDAILGLSGKISEDLRSADYRAMVWSREKGDNKGKAVCSTEGKVKFAETDWDCIKSTSPSDIMEHFSFGYQRITVPTAFELPPKKCIKNSWVGPIEEGLIRTFNPPCNSDHSDKSAKPPASPTEVATAFEAAFANAEYLNELRKAT